MADNTLFGFDVVPYIELILAIIVVALLARGIYHLVRRIFDVRAGKKVSKAIARTVEYMIIFIGVLVAFSIILDLQLPGLIVSLGIVTVAIAFASQQLVQNVLGGLFISITRPIELEDWIEVGGAPTTGLCRVTDITLLKTILRDVDGKLVYVSNASLITDKLVNYSKAGFIALNITLWVDSIDRFDRLKQIVYEEADTHPRILPGVIGEEKTAFERILERPAIKAMFGPQLNMHMFDPQLSVSDIQKDKVKLLVKIWIREINRKDQIVSEFLQALQGRFKEEGIVLSGP